VTSARQYLVSLN